MPVGQLSRAKPMASAKVAPPPSADQRLPSGASKSTLSTYWLAGYPVRASSSSAATDICSPLVFEDDSAVEQIAELGRRAGDLAPIGGEPLSELLGRGKDGPGRRLGAVDRYAHLDEELFEPGRAEGHEHAGPLGADEVGVRNAGGDEGEVARRRIDPLSVREDGDLAFEDVEGLVLLVVDVKRRGGAARIVHLDLREAATGLCAARLDGDSAGLPPDLAEALSRGDAVGLGKRFGCHRASSG